VHPFIRLSHGAPKNVMLTLIFSLLWPTAVVTNNDTFLYCLQTKKNIIKLNRYSSIQSPKGCGKTRPKNGGNAKGMEESISIHNSANV
jgi:hypothetical protein